MVEISDSVASANLTRESVYAAVGYALTRWEFLEAELCNLLAAFCGRERNADIIKLYSAGRIFRDRITNLDRVGDRYFRVNHDQALEAEYDRLSDNVRSASELRNNIAHGAVQQFTVIPAEAEDAAKIRSVTAFLLAPAYYNARKLILHSDERGSFSIGYFYSHVTIIECGDDFSELATRAKDYHRKIRAEIGSSVHKPVLFS